MAEWTSQAREALQRGPAALVTVLATEGSAPRGPGARMVVTQAGLTGTIGGGALEHLSAAQARAILALEPGSWRVQDYPLGPLLGQCCGGRVRLMVERLESVPDGEGRFEVILSDRIERRLLPGESRGPVLPTVPLGPGLRRGTIVARGPLPTEGDSFIEPEDSDRLLVLMFGAGHVGRAITARAEGLPLHFAWHDSRPEAAETPGVVLADEAAMVACAAGAPEGAAVVILTHDHALDYRLTAAALGSRARFVGLIGSRTKRARFLSRLAADGVDAARLTCPLGLAGISGKEPEVIAIATLAQLLTLRSDG
ncbi:MAG: xanthine dehydrogenase accessory factor [Sphingomonadales bacterium]|jgi:xanthine dehydrogenase accessory factor|nr:xanthine dehydrogenase accessory factor [Sphingomonadales bacterium]